MLTVKNQTVIDCIQLETDQISATATVSAPKLLKMSFGSVFGFGHESFVQATAMAETGDWFRRAAECV